MEVAAMHRGPNGVDQMEVTATALREEDLHLVSIFSNITLLPQPRKISRICFHQLLYIQGQKQPLLYPQLCQTLKKQTVEMSKMR